MLTLYNGNFEIQFNEGRTTVKIVMPTTEDSRNYLKVSVWIKAERSIVKDAYDKASIREIEHLLEEYIPTEDPPAPGDLDDWNENGVDYFAVKNDKGEEELWVSAAGLINLLKMLQD